MHNNKLRHLLISNANFGITSAFLPPLLSCESKKRGQPTLRADFANAKSGFIITVRLLSFFNRICLKFILPLNAFFHYFRKYTKDFDCLIDRAKETSILTDEQLITAARKGDANAFKELVKRYESRVAATVIGILGNCPEADDVGQETFIRFYKGLQAFRRESSVSTYLVRIAINLSLNELKRRKRRPSPFSQTNPGTIFDIPDEKAEKLLSEDKRVVERALQELKPEFRAVIVLRLLDGYSTEETAQILGVPVGTVLSRLARAQEKLRESLTPYWGRCHEQKDT